MPTLHHIEKLAEFLFPFRWVVLFGPVLMFVNGIVLLAFDLNPEHRFWFHYFFLSSVYGTAGLGIGHIVHSFAPGRGADARPRYRRMQKPYLVYALASPALSLTVAAYLAYAYVRMAIPLQQ